MTKAEFLVALKTDNEVVNLVGEPELIDTNTFGDRRYLVNVRKIKDTRINYENICFVVLDEGLPTENTYYYQRNNILFKNNQEIGEISDTL